MRTVRRLLMGAGAALAAVALGTGGVSVSADPAVVLKFDTMAPVTGPYVGSSNPVDTIPGGGRAWQIRSASGLLDRDGHLLVHVRGLVLVSTGTNPISDFRAIVACQSVSGQAAQVATVHTGLFPASTAGDADIDAMVSLPSPCIAPVVFVTSPGGAWFAATGL